MINTPCVSFASLSIPFFPARTRPPDTMGKLGGEQGTLLVAYISNQLLKQGQQHSRWVQIFVGIIEKWRHEYLSCTLYFNQPSGKTTLRTHLAASIPPRWSSSHPLRLDRNHLPLPAAWVLFSCHRKLVNGW